MANIPTSPLPNVETIVRDVETAPDALLHLKTQIEKQAMNTEELKALRGEIERSNTLKRKRELLEEVQAKIDERAAETLLQEQPAAMPEVSDRRDLSSGEVPKTLTAKLGDTAEGLTNTILPQKWTKNMSRGQKIAAGTAMTLGIGLLGWYAAKALFSRGKESIEEGEEAAKEAEGGFWKKLLIGTGIGLAVFFGVDFAFRHYKKQIEDAVKGMVPDIKVPDGILPSQAKPYVETAESAIEAAAGAAAGAGSKILERGAAQVDALSELPPAIAALVMEGNILELGKRGWVFLKKEGSWLLDNGTQMFAAPYEFTSKYLSGEIPDLWQGGWLYGEAGASYILGRATFQAILSGKIKIPMSLKPLRASAIRMGMWPVMMAYDGARTILIPLREDGRAVAKATFTRWGPFGWIRDFKAEAKAASNTVEGLQEALQYFKYQRRLIGSMNRELHGIAKGLVREESLTSLERSSERLAKMIKDGSKKVLDSLVRAGKTPPAWIDELAKLHTLSDAKLIVEEVDQVGGMALESAASATSMPSAAPSASAAHSAGAPTPSSAPAAKPASAPGRPAPAMESIDIADDAVKSALSPLRSRYAGEALETFDRATERCMKLGLTIEQTMDVLSDHAILSVLGEGSDHVERAMLIARHAPNPKDAMRKTAAYILQLGNRFDPKLLEPDVVRALIASDADASAISRMFRSAEAAGAMQTVESGSLVNAIEGMSRWEKMGKLGKGIYAGGVALEIAAVAIDTLTLKAGIERTEQALKELPRSLTRAGFVYDAQSSVYVHPAGPRVKLEQIEENLKDMNNPQWARVAADSAGALTTILAPSFCLGPGGLVVAGVAVTVQAGITAWEQQKYRDFVRYTPTPILALITARAATGMSEHDILEDTSNGMISDALMEGGSDEEVNAANEAEKSFIRKKMLASVFFREMSREMVLMNEILEGKDGVTFLNDDGDFLRQGGDFDTIVGPYIAARLFEMTTDMGVTWHDFSQYKIDAGAFDLSNITEEQLHQAVRESVVLYGEHLREKRFRTLAAEQTAQQPVSVQSNDALRKAAIAEVNSAMRKELLARAGEEYVLGQPLKNLQDLKRGTHIQTYIQELIDRLNQASERGIRTTNRIVFTEIRNPTKGEMGGSGVLTFTLKDGDLPQSSVGELVSLEQFAEEVIRAEPTVEQWKEQAEWEGAQRFKMLGIKPNAEGIYEYQADKKTSPLQYRYARHEGWQWSPDGEHWMARTESNARGGRYDGKSPSGPNLAFIQSLPG